MRPENGGWEGMGVTPEVKERWQRISNPNNDRLRAGGRFVQIANVSSAFKDDFFRPAFPRATLRLDACRLLKVIFAASFHCGSCVERTDG